MTIYCKDCGHLLINVYGSVTNYQCIADVRKKADWYGSVFLNKRPHFWTAKPEVKNANNDCPDFESGIPEERLNW